MSTKRKGREEVSAKLLGDLGLGFHLRAVSTYSLCENEKSLEVHPYDVCTLLSYILSYFNKKLTLKNMTIT